MKILIQKNFVKLQTFYKLALKSMFIRVGRLSTIEWE